MKWIFTLAMISLPLLAQEKLPEVSLEGKEGGRLDGTKWSSSEIKGKVFAFFYVDPDEKDLNEHVGQALKAENFPENLYGSLAVINMDATWLPNWILENALADKQKMYPTTLYVKDFKKVLVDKWGLKDDSSNIIIFGKDGVPLMKVMGKATPEEKDAIVKIVKEHLNDEA